MNNLNKISASETRTLNGGTTYVCPFCRGVKGSYWTVYNHAIKGCFKKNKTLNNLYKAGAGLITIGLRIKGML